MTPDEALSIADAAPHGTERLQALVTLAAEVRRLRVMEAAELRKMRAMEPDHIWHGIGGYVMYWDFGGTVFHNKNGTVWWHMNGEPKTQCETVSEAKRQLLEYAQSKCQKKAADPKAGG